jgi:hypothetical protein
MKKKASRLKTSKIYYFFTNLTVISYISRFTITGIVVYMVLTVSSILTRRRTTLVYIYYTTTSNILVSDVDKEATGHLVSMSLNKVKR